MNCPKCGQNISSLKTCPFCGAATDKAETQCPAPVKTPEASKQYASHPQKPPKKKGGCLKTGLIVILTFAIVIFAAIIISSLSSKQPNSNSSTPAADQVALSSSNESVQNKEPSDNNSEKPDGNLLIDDDYIRASYMEVFEAPEVDGAFYLRLAVENKSDVEVMIAITDASVNGLSTTIGSAVPMVIRPGESSKTPFIVFETNLDITEIGQLEIIKFKLLVQNNEDYSTLEESDLIAIPFNS